MKLDLQPVESQADGIKLDLRPVSAVQNPYQGLDAQAVSDKTNQIYKTSGKYRMPIKEVEKSSFDAEDINIHSLLNEKTPDQISVSTPPSLYSQFALGSVRKRTPDEVIQYNFDKIPVGTRAKAQAKDYIKQRNLKKKLDDEKNIKLSDVLDLNMYLAYFSGGEEAAEAIGQANIFRNREDLADQTSDAFKYLSENTNESYIPSIFDTKLDTARIDIVNDLAAMTTEERAEYYSSKGKMDTSEFFGQKDQREYMLFSDALKAMKNIEVRDAKNRLEDPERNYGKSEFTESGFSPNYDRDMLLIRNQFFLLEEMQTRGKAAVANISDMGLNMVKYMGEIALLGGIGGGATKTAVTGKLAKLGMPALISKNVGQLSSGLAMSLLNPGGIANLTVERMTDKGFIADYGEFVRTEEGQSIAMALPKSIAEQGVNYYIEQKGEDIIKGLFNISAKTMAKMPKGVVRGVNEVADFMKNTKIKSFNKLPKSLKNNLSAAKRYIGSKTKSVIKAGEQVNEAIQFNGIFAENLEEYANQIVLPILRLDDQYRDRDDSYLMSVAKSTMIDPETYIYQSLLFSIVPFASGAFGGGVSLMNRNNFRAGEELPEVANKIQLENSLANEYGLDRTQAVEVSNMLDIGDNAERAEEKIRSYGGSLADFSFDKENNRKALAMMLKDRGLVSGEAIRIADIVSSIATKEDATAQEVILTPEFKAEIGNAIIETKDDDTISPQGELARDATGEVEGGTSLKDTFGDGEKTKPRGLAKSVEKIAVVNDLIDQFNGIADYKVSKNDVQAEKVADIILNDYDNAINMALTGEGIPADVIPEMLYAAVANKAGQDGDVELLKRLSLESVFVESGTTMGKRIQALSTINKNSPFKAIQKIRSFRKEQLDTRGEAVKKRATKDIAKAEKIIEKADEKLAGIELNSFVKGIVSDIQVDTKAKNYGKKNKLVKQDEYKKLLAEIEQENKELQIKQGKGFRKGVAYVPTAVDFVRAGKLGVYHLEAMGRQLEQWSKTMTEQLGDWVKPHLKQIWEEANKLISEQDRKVSLQKIAQKIEAGESIDEMGSYIQRLAKSFVNDGIIDREQILDAVTSELVDMGMNPTRRDVLVAVSGYSKTSSLSEEEVDIEFARIKGELQQVGKLEDMQKGIAPSATGVARRPMGDEERRLEKQVNEAKKIGGFIVVDPKKQLKTTLDSIKTRLKNSIKDLEVQIQTKQKIVNTKTESPSDAETVSLMARRDELKRTFDSIFGKNELTDKQKIDRAVKAIERSIANYTAKIEAKDISKDKKRPIESPELTKLRETRNALKSQLDAIREELDPNRDYKTALEGRIKVLQQKIKDEDFAIKPMPDRKIDKEIQSLLDKRDEASRVINSAKLLLDGQDLISNEETQMLVTLSQEITRTKALVDTAKEALPSKDPLRMDYGLALVAFENYIEVLQHKAQKKAIPEKFISYLSLPGIGEALVDLAGTAKSVRASLDNSFIGRQGIRLFYLGIAGDKESGKIWLETYWKSLSTIFGSLKGNNVMDVLRAEILSDPNYDLMRKSKVATAVQEEEFPVHWPSKIPYAGRLFKASEEAFTASAYYMRFRLAQSYLQIAKDTGVDLTDKVELESLGRVINALTARGGASQESGKGGKIVNNILWSPKMIQSHIDTLLLPFMSFRNPKFSKYASKLAGRNLIRIIIGQAMVLAIAKLIWPESVEFNPLSSDFGKIKIGNTRYDISGGSASLTVLAVRLATVLTGDPVYKSTNGKIIKLNQEGWGKRTLEDVFYQAMRNKTAPVTSAFLDILRGETFDNEKTSIKTIAEGLFSPLAVSNTIEFLNDMDDMTAAQVIANILLESQGISVQTYQNRNSGKSWR